MDLYYARAALSFIILMVAVMNSDPSLASQEPTQNGFSYAEYDRVVGK